MKRVLLSAFAFVMTVPLAALAGPHFPEGRPSFVRPPVTFEPITANYRLAMPEYGAEALYGAHYLGPAKLGALSVDVALQMRNEQGLLRYAKLVNSPSSLYYRRFLTPEQLGDFFGASPSDYATAARYFWRNGLAVTTWKQRQIIRVVGSQANMERAFKTRFGVYRKDGTVFYAPVTPPRLSSAFAVRGLGRFVTFHHMRRHMDVGIVPHPFLGLGPGYLVGNSPFDLAAAFDYTGAYNINAGCCRGDGITIGIVGTGPISSADVPFFRSFFNVTGSGSVRQVNVTAVAPGGWSSGLRTPPPVTPPCFPPNPPSCNPEDLEAQLDTEQSSSLAPDATINFYLAYNPAECFYAGCPPALGIGETDDELQQIVNDNVADIVSGSYGIGELDYAGQSGGMLKSDGTGVEPTIFASLAAEGIAVFISSGDSGAESCQPDHIPATANVLCVSYPSDDPSVVSVGGTTTPIGSNGRLTGLITVWGVQTEGGAGGGGFSSVFVRPAFQEVANIGKTNICDNELVPVCDPTHRLQPDVSLNADPFTGASIIINCGTGPSCAGLGGAQIGAIGGTSASAPDMAAMWALVLQACKQTPTCTTHGGAHPYRLGDPNPLLYSLSAANKASAFFDVVYGNNAVPNTFTLNLDPGFLATGGWDAASGLGAPFARNLIKAIVGI